jgi:response regulator receiver domain-containing protein
MDDSLTMYASSPTPASLERPRASVRPALRVIDGGGSAVGFADAETSERAGLRLLPTRHVPTALVADDDERTLALLSFYLGPEFDVLLARDGEEALRLALVEQPDLILLGVRVPKLDGFEVTRQIRHAAWKSRRRRRLHRPATRARRADLAHPRSARARPELALSRRHDLEPAGDCAPSVQLVDDIDAVVSAIGPGNAEKEAEPTPESELALLRERPREAQLVARALVVGAFSLRHPVHVDLDLRPDRRRQKHAPGGLLRRLL